MARLPRFQITADGIPDTIFASLQDLRDGAHDALMETKAIAAYRRDGIEEELYYVLDGLGWQREHIAMAMRGAPVRTWYGPLAA